MPRRRSSCASAWRRSTPSTRATAKEQISNDLERDRFFTPAQAQDYGLIDRVVVDRNNGNGYSSSSS